MKRSRWEFNAVGPGAGDSRADLPKWTYQADIAGSGSIDATVLIEVRNGGAGWILFGTLSPSGTGTGTDFIAGDTQWDEHRARCTAITAGAAVVVSAVGGGV